MHTFPIKAPLDQFLRSEKAAKLGIPNVPTEQHLQALQALAWVIFQPLRDHVGVPIPISSGYRSPALNADTDGASETSQHARGEAMDLDVADTGAVTNAHLFHFIREHLPFDQLIWEHGTTKIPQWVHVSYAFGRPGRRRILRATKNATTGKTEYPAWTP